jgi:hypothetical protein
MYICLVYSTKSQANKLSTIDIRQGKFPQTIYRLTDDEDELPLCKINPIDPSHEDRKINELSKL